MKNFTLIVDAGDIIDDAVIKAIMYAKLNNCNVNFTFNGIHIIVTKDSKATQIVEKYHQFIEALPEETEDKTEINEVIKSIELIKTEIIKIIDGVCLSGSNLSIIENSLKNKHVSKKELKKLLERQKEYLDRIDNGIKLIKKVL